MVIEIFESDAPWVPGQGAPPLQSRTSFRESSSANGFWNFSKKMQFVGAGTVNPFVQVP
jgi:hypothetical protein